VTRYNRAMKDRRPSRLLVWLLLGAAFFAGLSVDHVARAARRPPGEPYGPLDVFAEVLAYVQNGYVEEVAAPDLVYGAIEGMMARLDPHTQFMRPEVYRALKEETSGEFEGLGLELGVRPEGLVVISPMADSPGERAGVLPGDRLVKIDGVATRDMSLAEATRRMKGKAGTKVALELMRDGFASPQSFTLVRDRVRAQSVEWRVLDRERAFLYAKVRSFQERTDSGLKKALDAGRAAVGGEIRGLVLDLRNDPGGLLDQAVRVSDRFLRDGIIVSTEGRARQSVDVERAHEKETEPGYPMIVLVNRGTASASEIVAGALQDHGRAVIMGTQTFGKGSVQQVIDLEDGSGLKLTVARYYTPKHRSIQELGITPDVVVPDVAPVARDDAEVAERDLQRHLAREVLPVAGAAAGTPGKPAIPAGDHQLRTALDYLRAASIFKASLPPTSSPSAKR
jgi:carboxyl-terminal processing protease